MNIDPASISLSSLSVFASGTNEIVAALATMPKCDNGYAGGNLAFAAYICVAGYFITHVMIIDVTTLMHVYT